MPLFVKDGTILPLADPLQFVSETSVFDITCHVYGNPDGKQYTLFEDDGVSYDFENKNCYNWLNLGVKKGKGYYKRQGSFNGQKYSINKWVFIK